MGGAQNNQLYICKTLVYFIEQRIIPAHFVFHHLIPCCGREFRTKRQAAQISNDMKMTNLAWKPRFRFCMRVNPIRANESQDYLF